MKSLFLLVLTFCVSLVSIYGILRVSCRYGIYDKIDDRKIHTGNVPRLGGMGIFAGFFAGFLLFTLLGDEVLSFQSNFYSLIAASVVIFSMGFWDDLRPWSPKPKFCLQALASLLVLWGGFRFEVLPLGALGTVNLGLWGYPLTCAWILGVINAVNLIDGMDGLASVITASVAAVYALFFLSAGNPHAALLCGLLVAAVFAFMVFNLPFPKAKIFMGDGGSQFLGFMLAVLPLIRSRGSGASVALPFAGAVLLIPLFDTVAAIWRRLRERRPIDSPDRFHIHHKLLLSGLSVKKSLLVVLLFQLSLGGAVAFASLGAGIASDLALIGAYAAGIAFFTLMHYKKKAALLRSARYG